MTWSDFPNFLNEAREQQQRLSDQVIREDCFKEIGIVAGVDVGFEEQGKITRAAAVTLSLNDLKVIEEVVIRQPTQLPYMPGFLSFRECPAILIALARLNKTPDLIFCDGHGIAHPRRFGNACHVGVETNIPSIGVGKSRLIGKHDPVPDTVGSWVPLIDKNETIGVVLRTKVGVRPIFISIGHKISLQTAIKYTTACVIRYRLPEPTRLADKLASNRK
ncbi:deoxyribonuclease V [Candidatus Nitrosacidococcus tergens]|uniref:Endonuclease V n=1 Tax=Candidatus Nitrosacidococcus tergens TaxID=553981 RepID=A0A7G1Q7B0_9GAMM|nr:deoxyribonuclease V [Candidatus Nitrosacidococcus tergens]CAB1274407.1 Endonuclease V [Candidatus Nitrosacidococcus tergens]